ncbi:probable fatty acyl-CoA reductase 4 isoform X2 [Syzygium oleosum]|uniref:probable fatty acyl-CoA reductase 4 isoform X2 n=1 Tax=Syzygium oleosum TaxID=219896 RepID=UPI0024B982BE|nr:probable fatty acyl-CoA reductase 4 isoform X2 [Syzygium oleosum]
MFLLIRAADEQSAARRLHEELIEKKLFDVLRQKCAPNLGSIPEKLHALPGDISSENLGLNDSYLRSEMWREIDIIVHSAATTTFDDRYDTALAINTYGAKHVAEFATRCVNIKMLLHVSTAYVCGKKSGVIPEKAFSMGETMSGSRKLDVNEEKLLSEGLISELREENASEEEITIALKKLGLQRARLHGWPNTYTLTKAMGEMMMRHHLNWNVSLAVVRPTIITSTLKEPFPGWLEGFPFRGIDNIAINYGRGKINSYIGDPDTIFDVIPVDMVVNAMIVAMAVHANQPSYMVYHVGSSMCNPLRFSDFRDFSLKYFTDNPLTDEDGKLVKVGKLILVDSMESFQKHLTQYYTLRSKEHNNSKSLHANLKRNINIAMRVAELHRPYTLFKGIFDETNTKALRATAIENGVDLESVFRFDPRYIDWEDYFQRILLPGISSAFKLKRAML